MKGDPRTDRWRSARKALLELPVIRLISFVLVFGLVRPVVASPFYVGSESMVPTLKVWYRVLINKLAYDLEEPLRGDIDARLLADVARICPGCYRYPLHLVLGKDRIATTYTTLCE